ncbi:hypothetical protein VKT23_019748 [Stygiomarasmius scandens]|uniref:Uncharacterized protein n=1 Tax=Marasmiellus scandens TaxID=2682957 RepID=A0ABR1IM74_9AGAR
MKSELGENWKNIDHHRDLAKRLGWVGYAQQLREEMATEERENGVKLVTLRRCIDEFMKVAQMCYNVYGLILVGQLHDLNNHNRSRMFGWGPEYDRMMLLEKVAFMKELKATAAKLRTCRDGIEAGLQEDPVKTALLREYNQGPDKAAVLRPLLPKLFKLDLMEAMDNVVKSMKWQTFLRVACTHQLRMIDYPKDVPIIGAKSKGLISHAKDYTLPALQTMIAPRMRHYVVLGKPQDRLTADERDALVTTFKGTRIITWLDEEKNLPLERQGDIPLMVDVEGNILVRVADVISSDGEAEEDERESSTVTNGKGKGKAKMVVSDDEDVEEDHDDDKDQNELESQRLPSIEPEPEVRESIYRTLPFSGRKVFTTPERQHRLGCLGQVVRTPPPPPLHSRVPPQSIPPPQPPSNSRPEPRKQTTFRPGPKATNRSLNAFASSSRHVDLSWKRKEKDSSDVDGEKRASKKQK